MRDTPRCFGVIGDPIDHSLSPTIHNAAFRRQRLHCVYMPLHVRPRDLKRTLTAMRLTDIEGCNVTTPHKQAIIPFLDRLDPSARLAGAVNTIYRRGGKWIGANTDGVGFLMACRWHGVSLVGKTVTILGAGGVASAIAAVLLSTRVHHIILLNRSVVRAKKLRAHLKNSKIAVTVAPLTAQSYRRFFPATDILIHATSSGMNETPTLAVPLHLLKRQAVVCDCQYRPGRRTALIAHAVRLRHRIVEGLELLLCQAAESFRIWTSHRAPLLSMRHAVSKRHVKR